VVRAGRVSGLLPKGRVVDGFNAQMTESAGGTPSQAQIDALEALPGI
jgi:hypothetical protein